MKAVKRLLSVGIVFALSITTFISLVFADEDIGLTGQDSAVYPDNLTDTTDTVDSLPNVSDNEKDGICGLT